MNVPLATAREVEYSQVQRIDAETGRAETPSIRKPTTAILGLERIGSLRIAEKNNTCELAEICPPKRNCMIVPEQLASRKIGVDHWRPLAPLSAPLSSSEPSSLRQLAP